MNTDRLYYLSQDLPDLSHLEQIGTAVEAGVRWIQLRSKALNGKALLDLAQQAVKLTMGTTSRLIINDHVNIALDSGAHGVHLGSGDMKISKARAILGSTKLIGGTANSAKEAVELWKEGVDYIGLGPFRFTRTKEQLSPVLGVSGIAEIATSMAARNLDIPVFAIGGIEVDDVKSIMDTGIFGVAVASFVNGSVDRPKAISELNTALDNYEVHQQKQSISL